MSTQGEGFGLADSVWAAGMAHRFYVRGQSKIEIAEEFGVSRFKVARVLDTALRTGLVRLEYDLGEPVDPALSEDLRSAYGLRRAFVLDSTDGERPREERRERLGALAARLLTETVTATDVLGLSWARSVNAMAGKIARLPRCPVVQLCGVQTGMDLRDRSVETVSRLADVSGGPAYPISAPLVLPDAHTADVLRGQPGIADAFGRFRDLTKAVVSIGAWREGESTVYDSLSPAERDALRNRGAQAEIAARLFDAEGGTLSTGLDRHVLGITHEELRRVPEVVALGYTPAKAEAVDAVLRSGLVSTLVTDADTARIVLDLAAARPPATGADGDGRARPAGGYSADR
ncbi:sugar-binding transcriptional regulator [Saccharomonospora iraqiensis]|uniref:sugar-binding transcriptional regulator n=1 Tax=Saccharomonospora iraqiensis TaxID=52698 RepID=UPI00022E7C34|nr:sugar-binding domain-containing protein [Saccharomonospora iraqiensis]